MPHASELMLQLDLITSLPPCATEEDRDEVVQWCADQTTLVLKSLRSATPSDASVLVTAVGSKGIAFISDVYVLLVPMSIAYH